MTAAIFYHPEGYSTTGARLMGRNAAGESFLRGYFAYSNDNEFWIQVGEPAHAHQFAATAKAHGRNEKIQVVETHSLGALARPGLVYYPGPGLGTHAWRRSTFGHQHWSLCGITHTTSSAGAMDSITELLSAPLQPWDALICTSTAVKDNVLRVLQAQTDYFRERLGITKVVLPQLPVIPLGIHTDDFVFTPAQKSAAREVLGADAETLVVLFTGRLSFHAKAHPLAMYLAVERAAQECGKPVMLVECGWHANDSIAKAYQEAAQLACPSVRVITLDGRQAEDRLTAWASADVFCSLADNIQETFGIVPLEAMAAGLPVVVADWDGYKDTVRDGIDGFRVPTLMPGPGLGTDLAQRHALGIDNYDMYCGHTCMLVAVDVDATTAAFSRLFQSSELRLEMGAAGRERARSRFDWRQIMPQYEQLWEQLQNRRKGAVSEAAVPAPAWPARLDPFHAFAAYPTGQLSVDTRLGLAHMTVEAAKERLRAFRRLAMIDFASVVLPTETEIELVLRAAQTPQPALTLVQTLSEPRRTVVFRSLVWLVKLGLLHVQE